jgi:rhodanese-related sulfurtransferase
MDKIIKYEKPKVQEFTLEGVMHVSVEQAYSIMKSGEAVMIDVRSEDQAKQTYFNLPKVSNIPLHNLHEKSGIIPKDSLVLCICNSGIDSVKAVNYFNYQGHNNAYNIDGGIIEWKNSGLQVVETGYTGKHFPCSGGCSGCC